MKNDILIAYYSWHGNTQKIANLIADATAGELFTVEPVMAYTTDYQTTVNQAKKEIHEGFRPELKAVPQTSSYSVVFLGSPIWWYTMAPPLATFIDSLDLGEKTLVPFYTHGGGGGGTFERDIAAMCPNVTVTKGLGMYESGGKDSREDIARWLDSIGILPRK